MQEIIDLLKQPNFWLLLLIMSAIFFIFWGISKLPRYKKCTGDDCKTLTTNRTTENEPLCNNCIEKMKLVAKAERDKAEETQKRIKDELCLMGGH